MHAYSYINGKTTKASDQPDNSTYNPSKTSELVGHIYYPNDEQLHEANLSAHQALKQWKSKTSNERGQVLHKLADALEEHKDEIAQLASREMGKPITEMTGEVLRGVQLLRYYSAEGVRSDGEVIPSAQPNVLQYTKRVPLGIVGIITPWNFPVAIPIWKIAPALICGNTILWKPAENASLSAYRLVELFHEAGLPEGVLNLLLGRGSKTGNYIIEDSDIRGLSFTGSTETGTQIAARCATRNIKYQTEMGGKNAAVIMPSANMTAAAAAIASGSFRSAGQKCTASSRIFIHRDAEETFTTALIEEMKNVQLLPATDPKSYLGPVASKDQFEKVSAYVELAKKEGNILYENEEVIEEDGYYIRPLIVNNLSRDHAILKEEIFGPIIGLKTFQTLDEAFDLVNESEYGLSASIFTNEANETFKFLDQVDVGLIRSNLETAGVEYQAPFGGMKQSSSYSREQGQTALDFYSTIKTCAIKYE
ncbi:aldehyde dehydrogenase [Bacillaceae bacterium JMAK1]|nr:aldehyde dehydrogenase [Bacillaceae bacterium JMAK1]